MAPILCSGRPLRTCTKVGHMEWASPPSPRSWSHCPCVRFHGMNNTDFLKGGRVRTMRLAPVRTRAVHSHSKKKTPQRSESPPPLIVTGISFVLIIFFPGLNCFAVRARLLKQIGLLSRASCVFLGLVAAFQLLILISAKSDSGAFVCVTCNVGFECVFFVPSTPFKAVSLFCSILSILMTKGSHKTKISSASTFCFLAIFDSFWPDLPFGGVSLLFSLVDVFPPLFRSTFLSSKCRLREPQKAKTNVSFRPEF